MPLIDTTYFRGELNIAALSKTSKDEALELFIAQKEPEYLRMILGLPLYNAYVLGTDLEEEVVPEPLWLAIRDGKEWTDSSGRLHRWSGLKSPEDGPKISPIANYVYFHYMRNAVTQTTAVGETRTKAENSVITSPNPKLCRAWNAMVDMNNELARLLDNNPNDYGEWWPYGYYYNVDYRGRDLFQKINTFGI